MLTFTLHRPGWTAPVSTRCHGMPCRDVPGRVHLLDPAGSLLLQPGHEPTPPLGQDGPLQAGLRPHVPTRRVQGALRGAGHALDVEVLDADHLEPGRQVGAGLLDPVPAPVALARLETGDRGPGPGAPVRPGSGAGEAPLQPKQTLSLFGRNRPGLDSSPVESATATATPRSTRQPHRCPARGPGPVSRRTRCATARPGGFRIVGAQALRVEQVNRRWSRVLVPKVGWVRFTRSRAIPGFKSYWVTRVVSDLHAHLVILTKYRRGAPRDRQGVHPWTATTRPGGASSPPRRTGFPPLISDDRPRPVPPHR